MGTVDNPFDLTSAVSILKRIGCPCRFPRFVDLVGFNFENYKTGPVACRDTESLVQASHHGPAAFLKFRAQREIQDSTHRDYVCGICAAEWEFVVTDYSIRMTRSYLRLVSPRQSNIGACQVLPTPVAFGFLGFSKEDVSRCARDFKMTSLDECISYLTETI